ncbi:MAG: gluconokinase, partial [Verrucomicrobiales bacterium]|nr:gluconokinase [Verrucomicrobiales bacterium]
KSTIGLELARASGWPFLDADDLHSPEARAKMAAGIPLDDDDRWPWYAILRKRIEAQRGAGKVYVLACSALKAIYRDRLKDGDAPGQMAFVLMDGSQEVIAGRLAARKGHFMPPALLASQLATLETTDDLLCINIEQSPEAMVDEILAALG